MDGQNTQQQDQPVMAAGNDALAQTLNGGLQFEETPVAGGSSQDDQSAAAPQSDDSSTGGPFGSSSYQPDDTAPSMSSMPSPHDDSASSDDASKTTAANASDLDKLKTSALDDLRPLVGKLKLSPEDRFDTLLLIIRSTDDQSLLAQAHAAAKEITDDTKRAEALLDVIKEVDYFNNKK